MDFYILKGKKPKLVDLKTWANWSIEHTAARHVAKTDVDNVYISTVFLGLDHSLGYGGQPLLFETMVFGGKLNEYQERCSTWEQAERQHKSVVTKVQFAQNGLRQVP